jgi:uncharacterized membrane protein YccC
MNANEARQPTDLTPEQRGLIVAALVAFFGVAFFGPALARLRRRPNLRDRLRARGRDVQRKASRTAKQARTSARQAMAGW